MTDLASAFIYKVTSEPAHLKAAANLVDTRDDNAHPLNHESFFRSRSVVIAMTNEGGLIGCAAIKEGEGEVAEMGYLMVSPAYRRRGVAQRLTEERVEVARRDGIKLLWATVRDENKASQANLLKNGWHFWRNYLSVRGTGNTIGWYYMPLVEDLDVDAMMEKLVGDRVRAD
ncbi:GNAT family N-acetyltransferase [Shewanella corallii]|uniref:GNAT family N-acetyltransferase n=2 Tax=Shewanella TaxID=22 RepID=A0ABT0N383_9GAMM|nr:MULTISPECIES: GNAT family N-acetyltransferase [Shewanella]MCL1036298.1 GNAT family N-acetyltransferase [Shewanella submarina]MCL2912903.1 GNAT family N-acetyltransferase [Shewanella corallii]